ncbi:MAG TPA: nuclear transport factor 2 family protein [Chitinophagaceae bacterium]
MKYPLLIILVFLVAGASAQTDEEKLVQSMKDFHKDMVDKNTVSINQETEKSLSYGHSNGWVQTKNDLINDFKSGLISYQSFKEDSINVTMGDGIANVRFVADIASSMKGNQINMHLKVLEVWVKKGKRWLLFARQAVK